MNRLVFVLFNGLFAINGICLGAASFDPVPFFEANCIPCHDERKHKGDVRLDQLRLPITEKNAEIWEEVVHNLQRGDMPPEDEEQPSAKQRQVFLGQVMPLLARYEADAGKVPDPLMRLTNRQIAHSVQDLLQVSRNIGERLIEDPIDKHGFSRQAELDISGGYFALFLPALQDAVADAIPQLDAQRDIYRVVGNDWEKQHFLSTWALSGRSKRNLYEGPEWLGDNFEIPLPPKHEYRMYLKDNRPEGDFRIRVTARNEPPTDGGARSIQELSVYLDEGFMRPYKLVGQFTLEARAGSQTVEFFGNVRDWVGVNPVPFEATPADKKTVRKRSSSWRILAVQNNNALSGFEPPVNVGETDRSGGVYLVRPDDQWMAAFGPQPGLLPSYRGPAGAHPGGKGKTPAIYSEVMKTYGHAIIESIEFELPYASSWPPPSIKPFLSGDKLVREDVPEKLRAFATRAWRRPLDEATAAYVDDVFARELAVGSTDLEALRDSITVLMSDPRFLYLSSMGQTIRDRNVELVSRLAYFLWDGPPDDVLLELADQPLALDDAVLSAQVDRLLADPRSERFVASFVALWIGFTSFDQIAIDPNYYPKWRGTLKPHMKGEAIAFFSTLLRNDLSCLNLLDSEFIMVNQRMGEHYGIPGGVNGMNFSRVPAPESRGGVLTQAAMLLAYSDGQDAHAVNRGVWVRSRLLGDPPSDPPPDVPALGDQDAEEVDLLSIKQRLQKHASGTCVDCHKDIDPWGIAMEGYDAVGMPRTEILRIAEQKRSRKKLPVVHTVEIDGQPLEGMAELKKFLRANHADTFSNAFSRHMLSYALGREVSYREEDALASISQQFTKGDHRMRGLIKAIVTSPQFRQPESHNE